MVALRNAELATIRRLASALDSARRLTRLVATGEGSPAVVSGCALAVTTSFFLGLRCGGRGAGLGSTGAANTSGGAGLGSGGASSGGGFSAAAFKIFSKAAIFVQFEAPPSLTTAFLGLRRFGKHRAIYYLNAETTKRYRDPVPHRVPCKGLAEFSHVFNVTRGCLQAPVAMSACKS